MRTTRAALLCLAFALGAALTACAHSPYAGQQSRDLKALSEDEVAAYLEGRGQGFAKPAELNGYPGPMHVLELARPLELTEAQREATRRLMDRHKEEVRRLGREYIDNERAIERLFAAREATAEKIASLTARSAELHARIRASHLATHVEQARILDAEQRRRYDVMRGYDASAPGAAAGHGHGHGGPGHRH